MQLNVGAGSLFSYQTKRPLQFIENKQSTLSATTSKSRYISIYSDRMLDAPEVNNNFCKYTLSTAWNSLIQFEISYVRSLHIDLNLLDWSPSNIVAVPLGTTIYCWNAETSNIQHLCETEANDDACSLAWIQKGNVLAVGKKDGTVELWDVQANQR